MKSEQALMRSIYYQISLIKNYKVGGPWKATTTNKQFLLVHLLDK